MARLMEQSFSRLSMSMMDMSGRSSLGAGGRVSGVYARVDESTDTSHYHFPERFVGEHEDLMQCIREDLNSLDSLDAQISRKVLERRRDHEAELADLETLRMEKETEIKDMKRNVDGMKDVIAQEIRVIESETSRVSKLRESYEASAALHNKVLKDLKIWREQRDRLVRDDQEQRAETARLTTRNDKELQFLRRQLGLEIRTVERDVIRFEFTYVDPKRPDRPFTIELDLGEEYKVRHHSPSISDMKARLDQLNDDADFYGFLIRLRKHWSDSVTTKQ